MGKILKLNVSNKTRQNYVSYQDELFPIIKYKDMPFTITVPFRCDCDEYEFSFYKGVIVQWDEDRDTRILLFIDEMDINDRLELLLVTESEGVISFLWNSCIPSKYEHGSNQIEIVSGSDDCDYWTIDYSYKISDR
jgi:hypothetical protein